MTSPETKALKNIIFGGGFLLGTAITCSGLFLNEGYNLCVAPGFLIAIVSAIILAN